MKSLILESFIRTVLLESEDAEIIHQRGVALEKRISPSWKKSYPIKGDAEVEIRHYSPATSNPYEPEYGQMVAWMDDRSIGWLNLTQPRLPEYDEKIAFDVFVSPEYQRLGVATALLQAVRDLFDKEPIPSSYGSSRSHQPSEDAKKLWTSFSSPTGRRSTPGW